MRTLFVFLTSLLVLSLTSSCCLFQEPKLEIDKGLLESSLKINDTILNEYEGYVKNDDNLDK